MNTPNAQLETAISIALRAHDGQTDKSGEAYILHPLAVMNEVTQLDVLLSRKIVTLSSLRIVAVLHDVVEDTEWTLEELEKSIGFPKEVIKALDLLTHQKKHTYAQYIDRIVNGKNEIARLVKLADLTHNLSPSRSENISDSQREKYRKAYEKLL